MAKQSSRQLVLERRKALSQGGKKAALANGSDSNRVRSASDARITRTNKTTENPRTTSSKSMGNKSYSSSSKSVSLKSFPKNKVSQPSRDLVLARRKALSTQGKKAITSQDRTRAEIANNSSLASKTPTSTTKYCCDECKENDLESSSSSKPTKNIGISAKVSNRGGSRRQAVKRRPMQNASRAIVMARREAQSKLGKTAGKQPTSAASVARQGNPDLSSREISQRVRELRSKSGATGKQTNSGTRPCGPNKKGAKNAAADAHWKVGVSETTSGQVVTGTQANRSSKTTGNEASTCRSITGTEYLGSEVFETFCQTSPAVKQNSKVSVTNTTHGNRVTGNEVGRSNKVTGNEPGTCKSLTGTEYISANQSNEYCGGIKPSPLKVGLSKTLDGRKVSGTMTGRSGLVTGDEAGSNKDLTGNQYLGSEPLPDGRPAQKVGSLRTVRGNGVTGTDVSRKDQVTGNEAGSCKRVTGDEYVGANQFDSFCGGKPAPEAPKVGLSLTNKSQSVSGTMTGRSPLVTGDEPGTCKAVTGTPYAGMEQSNQLCDNQSNTEIQQRTPQRLGTPGARLTGQQPGIGGKMTGAHKGACESLTGTPYVGGDQLSENCDLPANSIGYAHQESRESAAWTAFSVQSPARSAYVERQNQSSVTGTSYEDNSRITGPFDMAANKVTGTEQFRFDRKKQKDQLNPVDQIANEETESRPISRITGEGQSAGLNITGDDWARGKHVTGTEGVSSHRRNPSRPGPMNAMQAAELKRNQEVPEPDFLITGASGNTREGQLVTFSGGARG